MSNGCGAGEHWDSGAGCCVPDGFEGVEQYSTQVTYAAMRRVVGHSTPAEVKYRLETTISILQETIKKLNATIHYPPKSEKS